MTAIAELARRGNPARVLVLTTYDTDSYVLPAIEAGATGYLLKDAPRDELLRAVRAAAAIRAPFSLTRRSAISLVTGVKLAVGGAEGVGDAGVAIRPVSILRSVSTGTPEAAAISVMLRAPRPSRSSVPRRSPRTGPLLSVTSTRTTPSLALTATITVPPGSPDRHAGQHARHPDPDILAAFAYRLDLNAIAGGQP